MKNMSRLFLVGLLLAALAFSMSASAETRHGAWYPGDDDGGDDEPSTSTSIIEDYDTPLGISQVCESIGGDCFE